jgi:hypothetical protein
MQVLTGATEVEREAGPEIVIDVILDVIGREMTATEGIIIEVAEMEDPVRNLPPAIGTIGLA